MTRPTARAMSHPLPTFLRALAVATALLLALVLPRRAAAQVAVIVHPSGHSVTVAQVAEIFSGATTTWGDGSKVQLVDQPETATGRAFYQKVVRKPMPMVRAQWTKLALSGQALAPRRVADDAAVIEFVKRTPGAIGYVNVAALDGSVKEVARVP